MRCLAKRFEEEKNRIVVDVAAESGRQIADANPIDTGLSSGNWEGSIGAPFTEEQSRYYPLASRSSMNTLQTQKKKTGQSVFVSNPVEYVRHIINFGTKYSVAFWAHRAAQKAINKVLKSSKMDLD